MAPSLFDPPAPTALYTLSLHDALPIWVSLARRLRRSGRRGPMRRFAGALAFALCVAGCGEDPAPEPAPTTPVRSEEHTSELQSLAYLVCRLLLEKKTREHRHRPDGCAL